MDDYQYNYPPEARLISGPAGSGKTETVIQAILDERLLSAFGSIWVLLATDQQIHSFRRRLLARSDDEVQFGVEFFNFYALYSRLLDLARDPQRQVGEAAHFQVLRHVTTTLRDRGRLELFGRIAHLPGFVRLVADLVSELKQGLVQPTAYLAAAKNRGPKDRDLARIYAGYQTFLQERRLVDRHGAGWVALAHLEQNPRLAAHVDMLVVDGFDQFNHVHVRLLAELAKRIQQTVLTLPQEPGERGQRFRRFVQARERLLEGKAVSWKEQAIRVVDIQRSAVLDHLGRTVFDFNPQTIPADGSIHLIEAPDPVREVQAVLRQVKGLLLDGIEPDSIAVLTHDMKGYAGTLRETARAYGLPLIVRQGVPIRENPAVAAALSLIDMAALNFPRRDLLDLLHSPYFSPPDLSPEQIALLEAISMRAQVVRGRESWLDALQNHVLPAEDGDDETALDPAVRDELYAALSRFMDRITPPANGTAYDLTGWIMNLLGPDDEAARIDEAESLDEDLAPDSPPDHMRWLACIRASTNAERIALDVSAAGEWTKVLGGIRSAYDLLAGGRALPTITWAEFRVELELALDNASITPPGGLSRLGRVLATDVLEARGLPHDHIFLLGLSEGGFPAPESEDPLYPEGERVSLVAAGINIPTAAERSDDASLFIQTIGLARRSLALSRCTIDDKGAPCPPSPYWDAVRAAVDIPDATVQRIPVGAAPRLHEAATLEEAAVAVAAAFSGEYTAGEEVYGVYNLLLDTPSWFNVQRGRTIEAQREEPSRPFDRHSGRLSHPDLIAQTAEKLGSDHVWSASQLNDYGICPFRFFARRLLNLEAIKEPEEGLDVRQRGSINHAILEQTYRQIREEGLSIAPEHAARALEILEQTAASVFATAPRMFGFRPSPTWAQEQDELYRRLRALVNTDFSADAHPFRPQKNVDKHPIGPEVAGQVRWPFRVETQFGFKGDFILDGPVGPIQVRGTIDRVDLIDGRGLVVIDYKTGSTPHTVDEMRSGRDVQMMLYLLAAHHLAQQWAAGTELPVIGGLFWHVQNRKVSGEVLESDDAVDEAQAAVQQSISAARDGWFAVRPSEGKCPTYCDYGSLCRFSRAYRHKGM